MAQGRKHRRGDVLGDDVAAARAQREDTGEPADSLPGAGRGSEAQRAARGVRPRRPPRVGRPDEARDVAEERVRDGDAAHLGDEGLDGLAGEDGLGERGGGRPGAREDPHEGRLVRRADQDLHEEAV